MTSIVQKSYGNFKHSIEMMAIAPLFAIIANEAARIYFLSFLSLHRTTISLQNVLLWWLILQIVFAVVFGKISDKYCRKSILVINLAASLISIVFLKFNFLIIAIGINAILANILPIAIAAYCDVHITSGREPNIFKAIIFLPIAWIILSFSSKIFTQFMFSTTFLIIFFTLLLVIFYFKDRRDIKEKKKSAKKKIFRGSFFRKTSVYLIGAFFLFNVSWYLLLYHGENTLSQTNLRKYFLIIVGFTFFCGALMTLVFKFKAEIAILPAFAISFFIFFFDWITFYYKTSYPISPELFLKYTFFVGLVQPLIFSFYGKRVSVHEQGITYGFLQSVDSAAELIAILVLPTLVVVQFFYVFLITCSVLSVFFALDSYKKPLKAS